MLLEDNGNTKPALCLYETGYPVSSRPSFSLENNNSFTLFILKKELPHSAAAVLFHN